MLSTRRIAGLLGACSMAATAVVSVAPASSSAELTPASSTVLAGGGWGDGGPANRAMLGLGDVAAAPDGTLYLTRYGRIVKVSADTGVIRTVAAGLHWDDVAVGPSGEVYAAASGFAGRVAKIDADGTATLLATDISPTAVGVGPDGTVWFTQYSSLHKIVSGTVTTVVEKGTFRNAYRMAVSDTGDVYVYDAYEYKIYRITPGGTLSWVAGSGSRVGPTTDGLPPTNAAIEVAELEAVGSTVYFTDRNLGAVRQFTVGGTMSTVVASPACQSPRALSGLPAGDLAVVCDGVTEYSTTVRRLHDGAFTDRIAGFDELQPWSPDGVRAVDAYLGSVTGADVGPTGRPVFTTSGGLVRTVAEDGTLATLTRLASPGKVAVADDGSAYIVDGGVVRKVTPAGDVSTVTVSGLVEATDVEVSGSTMWVADGGSHSVLIVDAAGTRTLTAAIGRPTDLALDGDDVLVTDGGLRRVAADGTVTTLLTGGSPLIVAAGAGGPWIHWPSGSAPWEVSWVEVLQPSGALLPVRPLPRSRYQQMQARAAGVVVAGYGRVTLVTKPELPTEPEPLPFTLGTAPDRLVLRWGAPHTVVARAQRGVTPPRDRFDGDPVSLSGLGNISQIGGEPVLPGETWTIAMWQSTGVSDPVWGGFVAWTRPVVRTATVGEGVPPPVSELDSVMVDPTSARLSWTNPAIEDVAGVEVRRAASRTELDSTGGRLIYSGTGTSVVDAGLTHGQTYVYGVTVRTTAGNLSETVVRSATVPRADASLTMSLSSLAVTHNGSVTVTGFLSTPLGASGRRVHLLGRPYGGSWNVMATRLTDQAGAVAFTASPAGLTDYLLLLKEESSENAGVQRVQSATQRVSVAPWVAVGVTRPAVLVGRYTTITGSVSPAHPGAAVHLQQYIAGAWQTVQTRALAASSTYDFPVRTAASGTTLYRVLRPADADHLRSRSATVRVATYAAAISAIRHDPPGDDVCCLTGEYAVVKNTGAVTVNLDGWRLNAGDPGQIYTLPAYRLGPGSSVRIVTGTCTGATGRICLNLRAPIWNNSGDVGSLTNQYGQLVSRFRY